MTGFKRLLAVGVAVIALLAGPGPALAWLHPGSTTQYPPEGGVWTYGFWNLFVRSYYDHPRSCHGSTADFWNGSEWRRARGDAATDLLRTVATETGVELVRVTADLDENLRGKLFVALDGGSGLPSVVDLYDQPPARVVGPEALAHISASGTYLVVGGAERLPALIAALEERGVRVSRADPSIGAALQSLVFVRGFLLAFLAGCVMMATLGLYWLAVRAQNRALRVLGGASALRIQVHDLVRLLILVAAAGLGVLGIAALVIGWSKGPRFVPLYVEYFVALGALILLVLGTTAFVMSGASIPSPDLIARRQPATLGARRAADALKGAAFVVLVLTIGPAWVALDQAVAKAAELRRWETLADQVILGPVGFGTEADDERIMPSVGAVVREAEAKGRVALSMLFRDEPDRPGPPGSPVPSGVAGRASRS